MIEPRPVVFPGNGGGEFHQLRRRELFPQLCEEDVRHLHRSARHGVGVMQDKFFSLGEQSARGVAG